MQPTGEVHPKTAARVLGLMNPGRLWHRAELEFADRLPASGGAVIVSNHGRLDFDCFILAGLILRARGRLPRLLADHMWFKMPGVRRLWSSAGAVDGTRENAVSLLGRGELVLTYPGGVREIMGSRFRREHIDWAGRTGFAVVAAETGVPVIPVVGVGVNSGHIFLTSGRLSGKVLFQKILRLGEAYEGYRDPLTLGLLPVPLPFSIAVHLPLPCKLRYTVGEPISPTRAPERIDSGLGPHADGQAMEALLADQVASVMQSLIERHGRT